MFCVIALNVGIDNCFFGILIKDIKFLKKSDELPFSELFD